MKKVVKIVISFVIALLVVSIILIGFLFPNMPQKAVRLEILMNGHPIIALTNKPKRLAGTDTFGYSGRGSWRYYQVQTTFDAANGWININTLAVSKPVPGSQLYRAHVVYSVG